MTYISSRCSFLTPHRPGENCFILEDNTVQPFVQSVTTSRSERQSYRSRSTIGDHCFISSHVVVSGHVQIGQDAS